jgi:hypothetical protein
VRAARIPPLAGEQHSLAQEIETGSAVHLSFDRLDPVDVAFDKARAVRQCQACGDGVQVAGQASSEPGDAGQCCALGGGVQAPSWSPSRLVSMSANKRTRSAAAANSGQRSRRIRSLPASRSTRWSGRREIHPVTSRTDGGLTTVLRLGRRVRCCSTKARTML